MSKMNLAVQLYTLRDLTAKDMPGTLKEVAKIGFAGVELAGFGNLKSAKDVRKACDDAGLKICGSHTAIEQLEKDVNKACDESDVFGTKNIAIPWMPEERRKDAAGWKKVAQSMNRIAIDAKQRGFNVAYHNHSFEFQKFDGQYGLDIVWANSDALRSELDTYWVAHGGLDPVAYINQLGRRILLLHLKDMAPGADRKFAPVGSGTLDFKTILDAGNKAGVQWGIVEQDNCYATPPLQAIRTSFENLKQLGAA